MGGFPQVALLLQRGIVVGGQLGGQLGVQSRAFLGRATRNGFGGQLARFAALAQIPFDRREGHLQLFHYLAAGGTSIDRVQDALAEVG